MTEQEVQTITVEDTVKEDEIVETQVKEEATVGEDSPKVEKTVEGDTTVKTEGTQQETATEIKVEDQGEPIKQEDEIQQELPKEENAGISVDVEDVTTKIDAHIDNEIQELLFSGIESVFENNAYAGEEDEDLQVKLEAHETTMIEGIYDGLYPGEDGLRTPPPPPPTPVPPEKSVATATRKAAFHHEYHYKYFESHSTHSKVTTGVKDIQELKQQAECNRFAGYEKFASHFVDSIIDKSINSVYDQKIYTPPLGEDDSSLSSYQTFVEVFGVFNKWPKIQAFSREIGEIALNEFMQTWEYEEEWLYCIDFLLEQSDDCSEFFLYEAKWSIPTRPYPIPQATASIYFTIEVSRVKPPFCPVDVSYMFEGSRMVHVPGKIPFQETWLFNIIDAKLEMYKRITF